MIFLAQTIEAGVPIDFSELAAIVVVVLVFGFISYEAIKVLREVGLKLVEAFMGLDKTIKEGAEIDKRQTDSITQLDTHIQLQRETLDLSTKLLQTNITTGHTKLDSLGETLSEQLQKVQSQSESQHKKLLEELKPLTVQLALVAAGMDSLGEMSKAFNTQYQQLLSSMSGIEKHIIKVLEVYQSPVEPPSPKGDPDEIPTQPDKQVEAGEAVVSGQ